MAETIPNRPPPAQKTLTASPHFPPLRTPEEMERENQRLALLGRLAIGVAHDFNNILAATLIQLGLLKQDIELRPSHHESLEAMEAELNRASGLVRQLAALGRRTRTPKIERLDANPVIAEMAKSLRYLMRENITFIFTPSDEDLWIEADIGLLEQLVMMMALTVREALASGGTCTLGARLMSLPKAAGTLPAGDYVCLTTVADDALHVPSQSLGAVEKLVQQLSGWMEKPDKAGRSFKMQVYLTAAIKPDEREFDAIAAKTSGSETILLIEDEVVLRRVSALYLRMQGYAVHEAGDSVEAWRAWEKQHDKIDLVVTDFLLPGSETGVDLVRRMREERPSLKVIVISGHIDELGDMSDIRELKVEHMDKPFSTDDLSLKIRTCLDDQETGKANQGAT